MQFSFFIESKPDTKATNEMYINLGGQSQKPISPLSIDLGYGNFVKLSHYSGRNWIAVRKFDGQRAGPGITIPLENIGLLKRAVEHCENHMQECFKE